VTNVQEWWETIAGLFLMIVFVLGLSLLVAILIWKLTLHSRPLSLAGGALIFVASAVSACGIYGHAGPIPAVIMLLFMEPDAKSSAVGWMLIAGLLVTGLFAWWSHRGRPQNKS
jgi:hypothetical protein